MLLAAAPFLLAACSGPLSTLDPAGEAARSIAALGWAMFAGAGAVLVLVLALFAVPFRRRAAGQASVSLWILGGGIAFPLVVLLALLLYGLSAGERLLLRADAAALEVEATASRWRWEFRYPSLPAHLAHSEGALHIPAGRPVELRVTSVDVIHSFWVPRLAGKIDAIPGHVTRLRIEAAAPGIYSGVCAEYCGIGHARHGLEVVAHSRAGWSRRLDSPARVP